MDRCSSLAVQLGICQHPFRLFLLPLTCCMRLQLEAARRESAGKDGRLREALAEQAAAAAAERAALERQLGGLQAQVGGVCRQQGRAW